ncbi:bile acid:sodium symporter family protein [Planomonospora sphaerica]|nr:bile acid:sodium symporter [Planomonospora sphaerica]
MSDSTVVTIGLVVLLTATMLTIGTALTRQGLAALLRRPRALVAAAVVNVVVVPALALALVAVLGLDGPIAYGLVLAAAAPGGGTGALLAYHARGDLALAVSLQGMLAVLGLLAVPAWSALAPYDGGATTLTGAAQTLGLLAGQLVPIAAGMALRARRPALAGRVAEISRRTADLLLITLVVAILATAAGRLTDLPAAAYAAFVLLALVCLASYATPALAGPAARRAVAMTTTVRNLSLALLVAGLSRDAARVSVTVLAYGLVMYAACGLALVALRAVDRRLAPIT